METRLKKSITITPKTDSIINKLSERFQINYSTVVSLAISQLALDNDIIKADKLD